MRDNIVIGTQWGDEGKGKIVDYITQQKDVSVIVRYQGGNNAGHTVVIGNERFAFHLLPSGILTEGKTCVIGNGVIIDPVVLSKELINLEKRVGKKHAQLLISHKAHLIMPWHKIRDGISGGKIGTTSRGIGPTYEDYVGRRGIRFMDLESKKRFSARVRDELPYNKKLIALLLKQYRTSKELKDILNIKQNLQEKRIINSYWRYIKRIVSNSKVKVIDISRFLADTKMKGNGILFEGAQATLLDIAHGTYPYVTSSNPTIGGMYTGTGFRPRSIKAIGVVKAYTTRVGNGPFPTELENKIGEEIRKVGNEYGTTTGRPRRCGWLDLPIIKYSTMINGLDALAITKLDVLTGIDPLYVAVAYKINGKKDDIFTIDETKLVHAKVIYKKVPGWRENITKIKSFKALPKEAQNYISIIEKFTHVPVKFIGVGPGRDQIIVKGR